MPHVIVTRQFLNGNEVVPEGRKLVVTERRMQQLIANNLVAPAPGELGAGSARTAPRRAARPAGAAAPTTTAATRAAAGTPALKTAEAKAESVTPSTTRRRGGRTGEATPQSSSRQARPRNQRRSTKAAAAPAT